MEVLLFLVRLGVRLNFEGRGFFLKCPFFLLLYVLNIIPSMGGEGKGVVLAVYHLHVFVLCVDE